MKVMVEYPEKEQGFPTDSALHYTAVKVQQSNKPTFSSHFITCHHTLKPPVCECECSGWRSTVDHIKKTSGVEKHPSLWPSIKAMQSLITPPRAVVALKSKQRLSDGTAAQSESPFQREARLKELKYSKLPT